MTMVLFNCVRLWQPSHRTKNIIRDVARAAYITFYMCSMALEHCVKQRKIRVVLGRCRARNGSTAVYCDTGGSTIHSQSMLPLCIVCTYYTAIVLWIECSVRPFVRSFIRLLVCYVVVLFSSSSSFVTLASIHSWRTHCVHRTHTHTVYFPFYSKHLLCFAVRMLSCAIKTTIKLSTNRDQLMLYSIFVCCCNCSLNWASLHETWPECWVYLCVCEQKHHSGGIPSDEIRLTQSQVVSSIF